MDHGPFGDQIILDGSDKAKLLKQGCDRGFFVFLKFFIPFYIFRYWNSRFYLGAVIWFFFLSFAASTISSRAYENECRPDNRECVLTKSGLLITSSFVSLAAIGVFGFYGGVSASTARKKLRLDRSEILSLIALNKK
jgi:hypothetical protein